MGDFSRYFIFWAFPEFPVFSQIPEFYPDILLFSLSSYLTRDPPTLGLSINAETLSIPDLMLCPSKEINSDQDTHAFLSYSTNATFAFFPNASFVPTSGQLPDADVHFT